MGKPYGLSPRWVDDPPAGWAHDLAACLRFRRDTARGVVAVYVPIAPDKFKRLDDTAAHMLLALLTALGMDVLAKEAACV